MVDAQTAGPVSVALIDRDLRQPLARLPEIGTAVANPDDFERVDRRAGDHQCRGGDAAVTGDAGLDDLGRPVDRIEFRSDLAHQVA